VTSPDLTAWLDLIAMSINNFILSTDEITKIVVTLFVDLRTVLA